MPYKILILDDDADFNSLLTDIFEQADYAVTSLTDPEKAIEAFREAEFDLVVTDQKMPEMTGAEFMRAIKKIRPAVPVIMVSGYLENDTIRELIGEGVAGVFLKPLNIFSLLQRSNDVIADIKKQKDSQSAAQNVHLEESESGFDFPFRSFPGKTEASREFARKLYGLRDFGSTLTLIGPPGTHFRQICEDVRGFHAPEAEPFIYLSADAFSGESVVEAIREVTESQAKRATCVFLELDRMSDAQKELAVGLVKRTGVFADLKVALRLIFCLTADLDDLFDQGLINDTLYMLMGTAEVKVPSLQQCRSDIGLMTQQLLAEIAARRELHTIPQLDIAARDALRDHLWDRNYAELREVVLRILEEKPADTIEFSMVKRALSDGANASPRVLLESCLSERREELICAAGLLFAGDAGKVARFFGCHDVNTIRSILK